MVSDVADVVGVREFYIKSDCEIAFVAFLICVMVTVAIVAYLRPSSNPT